ncbi:MAG: diguanylate cyclase [Campylobacterales bacterium]|nr:diguanylate cyclase [Campylobacterales bacterium]
MSLFLSFGLMISIISYFVAQKYQLSELNSEIKTRAYEAIAHKSGAILGYINDREQLIKTLNNDVLHEYINDNTNRELLKNLNNLFLSHAQSRNDIFQLRYINENGDEIIRVDRVDYGGNAYLVSNDKLQNKRDRYYFEEVSKLQEGSIWNSKIDLNIEHGEIEIPIKPTFRVASPVYINSVFRGMVIVNLFSENFLKSIDDTLSFHVSIIDHAGEFIIDSRYKEDKTIDNSWSRYLKGRESFAKQEPEKIKDILNNDTYLDDKIFSKKIDSIIKTKDGLILIFEPKVEFIDKMIASEKEYVITLTILVFLISVPIAFLLSIIPVKLNQQLSLSKQKLQMQLDIIDKNVLISETDLDGKITYISSKFLDLIGYSKNEMLGKTHSMLKDPELSDKVYKSMWQNILKGSFWNATFKNFTKDKKVFYVETTITPKINENGKLVGFVSIRADITDKKRLEELSITDELTTLYNRRYFNKIISQELYRLKRDKKLISLAIIDIDYFKKYNDYYGHQEGDSTLKQVAKVIKESFKRHGDYIFRVGGEEFAIIFSTTSADDVKKISQDIVDSVRALNISHEKSEVYKVVTISLGVVSIDLSSHADIDESQIYKMADEQLYKAKERGRDRICFMDPLTL